MRTSSSVRQFFQGKNLSLKDLQTKAKPPGQDRLGRARELSKLKCKYCKTTARLYGSRFVCDPCKKIKEEENTVTVVLEREKRLAQRRAGAV